MTDVKQTPIEDWNLEALLSQVKDADLAMMIRELASAPAIYQPSQFWKSYVQLNVRQIQEAGLERFKTTVNQNYFNWVGGNLKEQKAVLDRALGPVASTLSQLRGWGTVNRQFKPTSWTRSQWRKYRVFLHLIWSYARSKDRFGWLPHLEEPLAGHPLAIRRGGKHISQDLCNSILEINAALEGRPPLGEPIRCVELGAGYGRVGYCLLHGQPGLKYAVIDIPPALYVAQWYLTLTVPGRNVFRCRPFANFETIRLEFESADIAFLLPHQVEMLPDKYFDLFLNISSLHEMTHEQIRFWFGQIDRICRGRFYLKQWIRFENQLDQIVVRREDYPVPSHWREIFNRQVVVQPRFFEALYDLA